MKKIDSFEFACLSPTKESFDRRMKIEYGYWDRQNPGADVKEFMADHQAVKITLELL